jgi:hypothetical protein
LRDDLKTNPTDWSTLALDGYLDGLGGWLTDAAVPTEPIWRTFARALLAAGRTK